MTKAAIALNDLASLIEMMEMPAYAEFPGPQEIATMFAMSRPSAYRVLSGLCGLGLIYKCDRGRWRISPAP
jgi:DNA-binding IclR family transcriptional regulator